MEQVDQFHQVNLHPAVEVSINHQKNKHRIRISYLLFTDKSHKTVLTHPKSCLLIILTPYSVIFEPKIVNICHAAVIKKDLRLQLLISKLNIYKMFLLNRHPTPTSAFIIPRATSLGCPTTQT